MVIFVPIGGGLIMFGLFHIFAKDYLWHYEYLSLKLRGIEGERTPWWYILMNMQGIFAIIIGGLLVYMGLLGSQ